MIDLLAGSSPCDDRTSRMREAVPTTISKSSEFARRSFQSIASDLYLAMTKATNGARLQSNPELRGDVVFCAQQDIYDLIAVMDAEGALRKI